MPTPAITTLRATIAAALTDDTRYSVFSFPPATPIANSVLVTPADPYLTMTNNSYSSIAPLASFNIISIVPLLDNQGNLNGIEDFMVGVFSKLSASAIVFNVDSVSAPSVLSSATGDLLTSTMTIQVLTSWS